MATGMAQARIPNHGENRSGRAESRRATDAASYCHTSHATMATTARAMVHETWPT